MIPIILNSEEVLDQEGFKNFLITICNKHKLEQRALAFAFLVYDFSNHTINSILRKEDLWNSINSISGKTLSVFYINSQDSEFARRQAQTYRQELREQNKRAMKGYIEYSVPVTLRATPLDETVWFLKKEFGIEEHIRHPFIIFFQVDEDDVTDSFIVTLQKDRIEDAFLELRNHIKDAVEGVSNVIPEYKNNHKQIFNLLKQNVDSGVFYKKANVVTAKIGLGSIISLVKTILGGH